MAFAFKSLNFKVTATKDTVYTTPVGKQTIIIGMRLSNKATESAVVDLYRFAAVDSLEYRLIGAETLIPISSALNVADGNRFVFMAGDQLRIQSTAPNLLDLTIEFLELDV